MAHAVPARLKGEYTASTGRKFGLTVGAAFVDLPGVLNPVIALAIACTKAVIVILFFMHVKYSPKLTWAVVLGSIFWLGILLTMTFADYLTRAWRTYG